MINRTVLVGRVTKDLELKYTSNNKAIIKFSLAVKGYGDKVNYINCIAWNKTAENMAKFVSKGSLIGIDGHIETGSYDAQDGSKRYTTDIVCDSVQFLDTKKQESKQYSSNEEYKTHVNNVSNNGGSYQKNNDDFDYDDLPF